MPQYTALPAAGALDGDEIIACLQSSVMKQTTLATQSAFTIDTLLGASSATPTTGDNVVAERSGTEKLFDLDDLAAYCVASGWSVASEADPANAADKFLVNRGGTIYELDIDTVSTYVLTGIQATVLDISELSVATLSDADQYLVCQGSTGKKTTWTAIAARAHSQFDAYLVALDAAGALADADLVYLSQSGTAKKLALSDLADYVTSEEATAIVATAWDASAVDPAQGTDVFVCERSDVPKTVTGAVLGAYTLTLLSGAASADPIVDADVFPLFRSGTEKTITAALLADYMSTEILADASVTPVTTFAAGDYVLLGRSGALTVITQENFTSEVLDGVQADVLDISGLATATIANNHIAFVLDGSTAKKATYSAVATYVCSTIAAYVGDQGDADPIVDTDLFLVDRNDTSYYIAASDLATYMITETWDQTAGTTVEDGDQFLMYRSGTGYRKVTGQMIETYISGELQSDLLDFSSLDTGTVAGTDYIAITQTTTPKKATVTSLTSFVWTTIQANMEAVDAKTDPVVEDEILIQDSEDSAALKRITLSQALELQEARWKIVPEADYTSLPASTTRINMSDTSQMEVGLPLRYQYGGTYYYGVIATVVTDSYITIRGAALDAGVGIDDLRVGHPGLIKTKEVRISGAYLVPWVSPDGGTSKATMLEDIVGEFFKWRGPDACLVSVSGTQYVADTTAQPYFNIRVYQGAAWHDILTENSGKGIQLGASGVWVDSAAVGIDASYYTFNEDDDMEINCDATGADGDADTVTLILIFVCK